MQLLLIADKDDETRRRIAGFFSGSEYKVIEADSVDVVLHSVLKEEVKVILLGSEFDGLSAREIIPLLKQCNQDLTIILVSNEESLALIRRLRREGIFYHALKPVSGDDSEEIRQVVRCAFHNSKGRRLSKKGLIEQSQARNASRVGRKGKGGFIMKTAFSTTLLILTTITPAFADEATIFYAGGILSLIFIGFLALILVTQLVPALITLLGFIKMLVSKREEKATVVEPTTIKD